MKLISIELYLYKPFLHHKTKHVTITDLNHVTVISGENACGKSSLLRACTPYPAVSTEFEKGGYKIAVYEHGKSIYVLTSDFRKSAGAHSFKKDNIELNESGTTEVQNQLVEEYFHYDSVVEKLVTGKFKICDMGKPERRTLFLSTYPSSMAFILDYYKSVSSRLRAVNNNIKMLKQRQTSLEQQLISKPILADYKKEREDLNDACSKLDLDIYTVNRVLKHGRDELNKLDQNICSFTADSFINGCHHIVNKFTTLLKRTTIDNSFSDTSILMVKLQSTRDHLVQLLQTNEESARELKNELDEYKRCISTDTESALKDCKEKIKVQDQIIQNTEVDPEVPFLSESDLNKLDHDLKDLLADIGGLKQTTHPVWTEEEYSQHCRQADSIYDECARMTEDIRRMKSDVEPLQARLSKYGQLDWPANCTHPCKLRDNYSGIVTSLQKQISELTSKIKEYQHKCNELTREYENKCLEIQQHEPGRSIALNLERKLQYAPWAEYVLEGSTLREAINRDVARVYNRLTHIYQMAKNARVVRNAKELKSILETKLVGLESNAGQAKQLLQETMLKKEKQLNKFISSINSIRSELLSVKEKQDDVRLYDEVMKDIDILINKYKVWRQAYLLKAEIDYFQKYVESVEQCKYKINEKLRELDQIIKEQDNYLVRLNDEVLPELKKLQALQKELAVVEAQLSPTKGISHVYIVRYINTIFKLANQFISRVWSYPMSLAYIDENDESFDYSFKLIINETSSIKDINIASAGQKSIINLCVMLAICIYRHYGQDYPVILDEVTINMSLNHQNSLITFLNELFADDNLLQVFIVDHCIDVCSSFASIAEMVCLSRDFDIGQEWHRIGVIE